MDRSGKEGLVSEMREVLERASVVVVTRQVGLTVAEVTDLRCRMREAKAEFKVLKNTLAQIAIKGTQLEGLSSMLQGPTALAYSTDPIGAAKAAVKYASGNEKFVVVGGCLNGEILSAASVKALATLPSLDELRSTLIALVQTPATKLAILLKEPGTRVARVISAKGAM